MTLKVGIKTLSLRQPLRRALQTAGRLGANGVQIDLRTELPLADCSRSALREIRKLLGDYRLEVGAVAFPTRRGYGDPAELDRRVAATRQAMAVASELGASVVVNRVGPLPEDEDDPAFGQLVESLTALGAEGERVGARLAATTIGDDDARLPALLDRLPNGSVGVDLHPAEIVKQGRSPLEVLASLGSSVLHVTAADAVRDPSQRRTVDVPLGRGMVDVPELLAALEPHDYRGWLTIERAESSDPAGDIGAAVEYLRNVQQDA